jgi:hypothetical protein
MLRKQRNYIAKTLPIALIFWVFEFAMNPTAFGGTIMRLASTLGIVFGTWVWRAPTEWSSLNVSAWSASGLLA